MGGQLSPEHFTAIVDRLPADPFDAVGIGWGVDDEGAAAITVAYHFAAEETATDNVETIAQVYSDGTSLQTGEPISERVTLGDASAEGQVVVVTLSLPTDSTPAVVFDMLQVADLPFLHQ